MSITLIVSHETLTLRTLSLEMMKEIYEKAELKVLT